MEVTIIAQFFQYFLFEPRGYFIGQFNQTGER